MRAQGIARPKRTQVEIVEPCRSRRLEAGRMWVDFGRAAFGTLRLSVRARSATRVLVHLGEKLGVDGAIDRQPPGCVRYRAIHVDVPPGEHTLQVEIPPDARNTGPAAVPAPAHLFEVLPFRYAEIETDAQTDARSDAKTETDARSDAKTETAAGAKMDAQPGAQPGANVQTDTRAEADVTIDAVCQLAVFYPFDVGAARFQCSDERLNRVWDLCHYSIKATSFCGMYVDGDRERIPYEADAYINQLCHYGVDAEYELARHTLEYLLFNPTWPTEWALHFVPMAWADYQYTGRTDLLAEYYDILRTKALLPLARADGLISTETGLVTPELVEKLFLDGCREPLRDLIDWPPGSFTEGGTGERDNYDMAAAVKTVVNAFHAWNLRLLARLAAVIQRPADAAWYRDRYRQVVASLHRVCFNPERRIFVDGEGSTHASLHANMMPAAFGLVPAGHEGGVLAFMRSCGMACSVYGAQYLLEACYRLGASEYALELMTAEHDRGWLNMLHSGSTVTLEAWDHRYKNNLDWNHAWGAAPANIVPRFLVGVRPGQPGFKEVRVAPQPGGLKAFDATVPTPQGPVQVRLEPASTGRWLVLETPVPARLDLSGLIPSAALAPERRLPPGRHELSVGC